MCGVMGYIGDKPCVDIIFNGLKRLEYRGYDSAGMAVLDRMGIAFAKTKGKLKDLEPQLNSLPNTANVGIGHTRWATHGIPDTRNAHPHVVEKLGIVHNGIIENYKDLKAGLVAADVEFKSDTDTEVVLHLLARELQDSDHTGEAIVRLAKKLKGAFSLGIIIPSEPDALYVVKQGSPIVLGIGNGENFFGSDAAALVEHTKRAIFLEDGEFACLTKDEIKIFDFEGKRVHRDFKELVWTTESVEKRGYAHFMMKEIHEQPTVIANMAQRFFDDDGQFNFESLGISSIDVGRVQGINILACGTAFLSGLIGKYAIESIAGIPVNVELASEFRYRRPVLNENMLTIAVTQSGETMDTLESTKFAKRQGSQVLCICNVHYSSITREADGALYMECGPEIGVASTKAFTAMVLSQYLFAHALAEKLGREPKEERMKLYELVRSLPTFIDGILTQEARIKKIAEKYYESPNFLFIGRGEHFPIALEGALKLKEISYIHAEGYAAGELKHGPIALIDKDMPVLCLAPQDEYYDKALSNIEQVSARQGRVVGVGTVGDDRLSKLCDDIILVPKVEISSLQAILSVVPLQIFSYYMALLRGTDVDQPRNLAKSVTVE